MAAGEQTAVSITTELEGTEVIEPIRNTLYTEGYAALNGIHKVCKYVPFKIWIANFKKCAINLRKGTIVARVLPCRATLLTTKVSTHQVLLGESVPESEPELLTSEEKGHGGNASASAPIPPEIAELDLSKIAPQHRDAIRQILARHAEMLSGYLGEFRNTVQRIAIIPGARTIRQMPHRQAPKGREVEQKEVERMMSAGVIRPSHSE